MHYYYYYWLKEHPVLINSSDHFEHKAHTFMMIGTLLHSILFLFRFFLIFIFNLCDVYFHKISVRFHQNFQYQDRRGGLLCIVKRDILSNCSIAGIVYVSLADQLSHFQCDQLTQRNIYKTPRHSNTKHQHQHRHRLVWEFMGNLIVVKKTMCKKETVEEEKKGEKHKLRMVEQLN